MKVEIDNSLVNFDKATKDEMKKLKKEIGRLTRLVARRDETIVELSHKANECGYYKDDLEELRDKIRNFFKLHKELGED